MSEALAVKHKNSLALTEQKLLQEQSGKRRCCQCTEPYKLTVFCIVMLCVFVLYWFVLGPLLIHAVHGSKNDHYSKHIFITYWVTAFFIWIFVTLCITVVWKCVDTKQDKKVKLQTYGTSSEMTLGPMTNEKGGPTHSVKFVETKEDKITDKEKIKSEPDETDKNNSLEMRRNRSRKHKDLPPLVIHRRNSGNNIENTGKVNLNSDSDGNGEDSDALKSGNIVPKIQRQSMQDYLKLVTVTPDDDTNTPKSPKGPLSPRELFFIDLIKAAEEADQNKENGSAKVPDGKHFFPNDFSSNEKGVAADAPNEKKSSENPLPNSDPESTYFIANVESPKSEKTEVYIDVNPENTKEIVAPHSINLIIKDSAIAIEEETQDNESEKPKEKVVVFKV
ncbi:uncharacterized protein LOC143358102 [Halictus rubicundus]|uniref:uncharacterized protein LOC143358102 n=1 Tax=Halictus rubicundus TaxID=77578 RepID=UPI004035EA76